MTLILAIIGLSCLQIPTWIAIWNIRHEKIAAEYRRRIG